LFVFNRTKKTCRIRRGFEQLSSYSGCRVITKKPCANLLVRVVVKGSLKKSAKLVLLWLLFSVNDSVTSCAV